MGIQFHRHYIVTSIEMTLTLWYTGVPSFHNHRGGVTFIVLAFVLVYDY